MVRPVDDMFELFPKLIDMAGRQRMLSQRIGFFLLKIRAAQIAHPPVNGDDVKQLAASLSLFTEVHQILVTGQFRIEEQVLRFDGLPEILSKEELMRLDRMLRFCVQILEELEETGAAELKLIEQLEEEIPDQILSALQRTVNLLQTQFADRSKANAVELSQSVEHAKGAIKRIETAARYSRMVSLNARVAAGRAGRYGDEFSALSTELKTVADTIQEAADDVRVYLQNIA